MNDAVVVLAYLPTEALRRLATMLPEVDAIVGGPTHQPLEPQRVGAALVASATHQGKFLARIDVPRPRSDSAWSGHVVPMSEQIPDDADQAANLDAYYAALAQRDFTPDQTGLVERLPAGLPSDYRVAGTAECRKCHIEEGDVWSRTQHARAWRSLEGKKADVDPDCQRCHSDAYGQPGGRGTEAGPDRRPQRARAAARVRNRQCWVLGCGASQHMAPGTPARHLGTPHPAPQHLPVLASALARCILMPSIG